MISAEIFVKRQETSEVSAGLSATHLQATTNINFHFRHLFGRGESKLVIALLCCSLAKSCFTLLLNKIAKPKLCFQDSSRVVNKCIYSLY